VDLNSVYCITITYQSNASWFSHFWVAFFGYPLTAPIGLQQELWVYVGATDSTAKECTSEVANNTFTFHDLHLMCQS